jgi:predicted nucleotidyltransferase
MTLPEDLDSLVAPLAALQRLFDRLNARGVVIGGVAVGLLGKPRLTVDVDAVLMASVQDIPRILEYANQEGIEPRIEEAAGFAHKNHVLLLRHKQSKVNIDISLGMLPFENELVERSILYKAGSTSVRLPTPEDLIILKAVAHRSKDLIDLQSVCENNPDLDRARVEHWVKAFAEVMEMPEIWEDIKKILAPIK